MKTRKILVTSMVLISICCIQGIAQDGHWQVKSFTEPKEKTISRPSAVSTGGDADGEEETVFVEHLNYIQNAAVSIGGELNEDSKYMFGVAGVVGANRIEVVPSVWADDVFYDDYTLKSLEEVELFINENKHLPDVPSEKEIKETKLDLGEMDATLLRKIEELTLYVIEQNKKIEALEEELNALKQ